MDSVRTTYLSAIGGGLGDIIVALPVIRALIERARAQQEKVVVVMRTPRQAGFEHLIAGLSGTIKEVDLSARELTSSERYINLRGHRLQTDYFWGGPEFERDYPAFKINDILKEMCKDFDIAANFDERESFPFSTRSDLSKTAICVPGTTVDTKSWAVSNWMALKKRLEDIGLGVAMLGQPEYSQVVKEMQDRGFKLLPTPTITNAVDILSSARVVISVDTGLMHLAVQQGTPTVCLFQDPIFYRPYGNAHKLLSNHCAAICVENRMSSRPEKITEYRQWTWETCKFNACLVPESERCINSILVDDVWSCLQENVFA